MISPKIKKVVIGFKKFGLSPIQLFFKNQTPIGLNFCTAVVGVN
jgi:hypothetical protein